MRAKMRDVDPGRQFIWRNEVVAIRFVQSVRGIPNYGWRDDGEFNAAVIGSSRGDILAGELLWVRDEEEVFILDCLPLSSEEREKLLGS